MLIGGQVPLSRFPLFRSTDFDETRMLVGQAFCSHRLNPLEARPKLAALQNRVVANSTAVNFLRYGTSVAIEPGELETFFLVQIPTSGNARISCGPEEHVATPTEASVLSPTGHIKMRWSSDCNQLIVWMKKEAVEQQLAALLGHRPRGALRFRLGMPLDTPQGQSWVRAVNYFMDELASEYSWTRAPIALAYFERTVMTALLYAQSHNFSDELHRDVRRVGPAAVRRAEAYLQEHIGDDVAIEDVAVHAGVSVRTLQANFSRFRGSAPLEYLRELRLEGARRDLLRAKNGETVTDIALRWRFSQLGRFAQIYRRRFAETPSQTLLGRTTVRTMQSRRDEELCTGPGRGLII